MRSRMIALAACALLVVTAGFAHADNVLRVPLSNLPGQIGWVEDEFIVEVTPAVAHQMIVTKQTGRPQVNVASVQSRIEQYGVDGFRRQFPTAKPMAAGAVRPDLTGYYKVKLLPGADLETAMAAFKADPNVDHVEKIGIHTMYATPDDPYYQGSPNPNFPYDQWHYWDTHSIHADQAWDASAGDATVVVGILDSGTRYFHVDIGGNSAPWGPDNPFSGGNVFINPGETPGNGIDDDGNGYVDDVIGWDFVASAGGAGVSCIDQDCGTADNDPDDGDGHGTHVSGTVAAITNNNILVAGIAGGFSDGTTSGVGNGVKLLPCRIGYHARYHGVTTGIVRMDWAAEAMNYVADMVDAGVNVAAINCSWGSSNSGGLGAAVDNLLAHDVVICVAAGNSNSSNPDYLGSRGDCMDVAATDKNGNGASFTNYGSWVDVAAPGVEILSTYRNPDDPDPTANYIAVLDGTSMSSPHVAGIVGLLESCNPSLTAQDKMNLIINNTDPYSDSRNLGSGIANAMKAFDAAGCSGGQPCDLTSNFTADVTSGCASLTVNFSDLSSGTGIDGWDWAFGDGGTSTSQNPSHSYTSAGTYSVTLTVSSSSQSCSDALTKTAYITVSATPVADFSGSPTSGSAPLSVNFTDQSSGNPSSWAWTFGDNGTSTAQNPSHSYANPGTYTVTLTASNACGSDLATKTNYITVTAGATQMYVFDVSVGRTTQGPWVRGQATVTIYGDNGSPVSNATVSGDFTGPTAGTFSGATNGSGQVSFTSDRIKNPSGEWCFEVTNVTHATLTYNASLNNATQACESGVVFSESPTTITNTRNNTTTTSVYPNPFNAGTNITFRLTDGSQVDVTVFNVLGQAVRHLASDYYAAGDHTVYFDGNDDRGQVLGSGMYFYRVSSPSVTVTRQMLLLK